MIRSVFQWKFRLPSSLVLLFVAGAVAVGLFSAVSGCSADSTEGGMPNVDEFPDLTYAELQAHERHKLDLYLPADRDGAGAPVVVWIHGGVWTYGDKGGYNANVFEALLNAGIGVASINYRYTWQERFPAQLHDAKVAVRFLRASADQYGIDPDRILAGGSSSGGYLAAMLATTADISHYDGLHLGYEEHASSVAAVLTYSTPVDLEAYSEWDPLYERFGTNWGTALPSLIRGSGCNVSQQCTDSSTEFDTAELSPINHVDAGTPPFYIEHNLLDTVVPVSQARSMRDELKRNNIRCELEILDDGWHLQTNISGNAVRFIQDVLGMDVAAHSNAS